MEIFYTQPSVWLVVLVCIIGAIILLFLIEAFILRPLWEKSRRPRPDRWGIHYETYWYDGRIAIIYPLYVIAGIAAIISFVLLVVSANYTSEHDPREVESTVSSPTTIAEDGTQYVVLDRGRFTYICGDTDDCEGLKVGDKIVYTRYADDNDVIHRYELHRK